MRYFVRNFIILFLFTSCAWAQQAVEGTIQDASTREPLIGVTVQIKGTKQGTISDVSGNFKLTASVGQTLHISYVGYKSVEWVVPSSGPITIQLESLATELSQVVVVGYGQARKVDITGATASVKGEDLIKQPVMTATQAIQGKVAGVQVIASGRPGSSPVVRIRGTGTALAGTATLFVVDGVLTDDISNINTQDIVYMDILKDASATSIYGARGANGVVIITTKRGEKGKLTVDYHLNAGVRSATRIVPMANAAEYANYVSAASGRPIPAGEISTDWYREILRNGPMQNHNLSISQGTEKASTFFSFGFLDDRGIVLNNDFKRYTGRINIDYNFHKKVKAGWTASITHTDDRPVNLGAAYNNAYRAAPIIPSLVDGKYGNTSLYQNVGNPVLDLNIASNQVRSNRLQGSAFVSYQPIPSLTLRSSLGAESSNGWDRSYTRAFENDTSTFIMPGGNQRNPLSGLRNGTFRGTRWVMDHTAQWQLDQAGHRLGILIGTTAEGFYGESFGAFRQQVPAASNLWFLDTGNANTSTNFGNGDQWARQSYLSRVSYQFRDRYLFTGTFRADGSSRFPVQNRWGYFPSIGAGWVISQESFMANQSLFDLLKLRASWGLVGNDRIASDAYIVTVDQNLAYAFGGGIATPGSAITQIKDNQIKWETTAELSLGLDFSLLQGRLQGEIGYYDKKSRDLLINVRIPSVTGDRDGVVLTNAASIQNRGLETALSFRDRLGEKLSYRIGGNASFNRNTVVGLNGGQPIIDGGIGAAQPYTTRTDNGQPVGSFYILQVLGVFQTDGEVSAYRRSDGSLIQPSASAGDFKYLDANGDGRIDDNDRVFAGSYQPKVFFGGNVGVTYGNWDLSLDLVGQAGNYIYNGKKAFRQALNDNVERDMAYNRWVPGSNIQNEPKANAGNLPASTYFLERGDFFRLNNVTLSYQVPSAVVSKLKLGSLKAYVTAQNMLTWTRFSGFTPELLSESPTNAGIELNAYPMTKTIAGGIQIQF